MLRLVWRRVINVGELFYIHPDFHFTCVKMYQKNAFRLIWASGCIPKEYFREIMTTLGEKLSDEEVDEMLDMVDADGDGKIDIKGEA